ncbi:hypothetical protein GCM10010402_02180 [Actinomadura luteofluorescens]
MCTNRVSEGNAMCRCECSICWSSVVPERGHPSTKMGLHDSPLMARELPAPPGTKLKRTSTAPENRRSQASQQSHGPLTPTVRVSCSPDTEGMSASGAGSAPLVYPPAGCTGSG